MNFKKRVNGSWVDIPHYIHNTSTDTITTLPADLYPNDTTATVGISGNMEQNGTPTPQNPITPSECGDLETSGTKAGQYKILISSANTTTPVYLGEVETTRKIRKVVLTGEENITTEVAVDNIKRALIEIEPGQGGASAPLISTHYGYDYGFIDNTAYVGNTSPNFLYINDNTHATDVANFKSYLAAQYAAGTPVTVWYVLAEPTTGIVNEPLRKIGEYADTVSGISIPTIAGANTISIDTTLQPSEVSVTYPGWHPVTDVHERENGQWD